MSANALARVIYQVDSSSAAKATGGAKLVIVDRSSRQVLPKKPWFFFGKDIRYLRVMSRSLAVEGEGPRVEVQGSRFDDRLELRVKYRARCLPGKEEQLAVALGLGERPDLELNNWLHQQLETIVDGLDRTEDLYSSFHEMLPEVERQLSSAAARELGLSLTLQIRTQDRGDAAERIDLSIRDLEVHAKDSDERIRLQIDMQLEVEDTAKALRHSTSVDQWEKRLAERVRRFVSKEVALNELAFDLRVGLRSRLQKMVDLEVARAGRRVGYLRLDSSYQRGGLVRDLRLVHDVECDIQGSRQQVDVQHVIQLELSDLGKFQTAGIRDFESWVRRRLDRITRNTLFEMTYRDLLVQFAPGESQGPDRLRLQSEALLESVGYVIRQMTVVPDLEPLRWKEGFSFKAKENTYSTLDPKIEVGLEVVAEGRITDIFDARLSRYLNPKASGELLVDIEKRMISALAGKLHGLSPERFYMQWRQSDAAGGESVADFLTRTMEEVMSQEFAVTHPRVILKPLETELTQRVEMLISRLHPLSVEVVPLGGKGLREKVVLEMNVRVIGVHQDGWHTFRARRYESTDVEIEETLRLLKNEIEATLATIPSEYLQFVDRRDHLKLQEVLSTTSRSIAQACGLVVVFTGFRRQQTVTETGKLHLLEDSSQKETQYEIDAGERRRAARLNRLESQVETDQKLARDLDEELQVLLDRKQGLLKDGVESDDPEFEAVQERIDEIRESRAPAEIDRRGDPLDHLEYRDRSTLQLEEYGVGSDETSKSLDTGRHDQKTLT